MNSIDSPYENLANAIVLQAVKDYRQALKRLKVYPNDSKALSEKREVEQFFRSEWFEALTNVDPGMLISRLCKEVAA